MEGRSLCQKEAGVSGLNRGFQSTYCGMVEKRLIRGEGLGPWEPGEPDMPSNWGMGKSWSDFSFFPFLVFCVLSNRATQGAT